MQSAKYQLLSKPGRGGGGGGTYPWLTYIGELLQGLLLLLFTDSQVTDSLCVCKINGGKNKLETETKWSNNYCMKQ